MIAKLSAAWRATIIVCVSTAAVLPIAARVVAGPRGARVIVRWEESIDATSRQRLQTQFRLADGEPLDASTWRYDLTDPSPDILRAVVLDPAVVDTQGIDRSHFILDSAERTERRVRMPYGNVLVTVADAVAIILITFVALLTLVAGAKTATASVMYARARPFLFRAENRLPPYVLLAVLAVAIYGVALKFPPTNGDDLGYLASVTKIGNPLYYFIQDHGHGNGLYRPLTPVSMWLVYKGFGLSALPNQLINLVLHIANVFLLYTIVRRAQSDTAIALLVAGVFMVSRYTFLAATWTSDRPMVLTGLFLLLLINHLTRDDAATRPTAGTGVRLSVVAAFSVLALMSKESGLVIPAVAFVYALAPWHLSRLDARSRLRLAVMAASIIGLYLLFRRLIFGTDFASYSQDGYMFLGSVHYEDSAELPGLLQFLNYAENVLKNMLAPVLPVFAEGGALLDQQYRTVSLIGALSTGLMCLLAIGRDLTRLQRIALIILVVNAVVHFSLFRMRLHYLSHAAFCLFVAASPRFATPADDDGRRVTVKVLTLVVLVCSIVWTNDVLRAYLLERNRALSALPVQDSRRDLEEQVVLQYR
jgi:hypothetical protein